MTEPLITTIIPTYKRPQMLKRAVLSALNQTYTNIQVCIYDNASGDETAQVVAELMKQDARVKYFCHPENIGSLANYNFGMRQVNTPYASLLSDDDVLLPSFYETAMLHLEKYPKACFFAGVVLAINQQGEVLSASMQSWSRTGYFEPREGLQEMLVDKHPILTGMLFHSDLLTTYGPFSIDTEISDVLMELLIVANCPFVISNEPCGIFYQHDSAAGIQRPAYLFWKAYGQVPELAQRDTRFPEEAKKIIAQRFMEYLGNTALRVGITAIEEQDHAGALMLANEMSQKYGKMTQSRLLHAITNVCMRAPVVNKFISFSIAAGKWAYYKRRMYLLRKYNHFAQYLELPLATTRSNL